jgi:hypothetical protein
MSRESFDSYRRSFDISARSPISCFSDSESMLASRTSLDSSRLSLQERRRADWPEDLVLEDDDEAAFEDVRLGEDTAPAVVIKVIAAEQVTPMKKKGLFARFGAEGEHNVSGFFSSSKKRQNDAELNSVSESEPLPPMKELTEV